MAENLNAFLQTNEFASDVLIGPLGHEVAIKAIFDDEHLMLEDLIGQVSTAAPKLICKSSDVLMLAQGARVVVAGVEYKVWDLRPDGTGITEVNLHTA